MKTPRASLSLLAPLVLSALLPSLFSACLGSGPEIRREPAPAPRTAPARPAATPSTSPSPSPPPAASVPPPAEPLVSGVTAASGAPAPFCMLTIGDSVMWGQGLRPEERFRTRAREHIAAAAGRAVVEYPYAHSGATIGVTDEVALADDDPKYLAWHGEVNRSFPLIEQQLERFVRERPEVAPRVELVLMDGGINDVNVMNMLDPRTDPAFIERRIEAYCKGSMTRLLRRVTAVCPRARVIVTGYYAAISADSAVFSGMVDLPWAAGAAAPEGGAKAGGAQKGSAKARPSDAERAEFLAYLAAVGIAAGVDAAGAGGVEGVGDLGWIGRMIGERTLDPLRPVVSAWSLFHARASAALAQACAEADPTGRRITFVDPGFGPTNAAHASAPLLYPFKAAGAIDPLAAEREAACAQIFPAGKARVICARASAGHPNARGAVRYFDAMVGVLDDIARGAQGR